MAGVLFLGGPSSEIDAAYDRNALLTAGETASLCQYCDKTLNTRNLSARRWFCRACADEVRGDSDHWGRLVRARERLLAA